VAVRKLEVWTTITLEVAHTSAAQGVPALHGHSYWISFYCATRVEDPLPLANLDAAAAVLRSALDHRNLDALMPQATMEGIAQWCADHWHGPRLTRVVVRRESLGCGVEWRP
jgi:hypothetical protein